MSVVIVTVTALGVIGALVGLAWWLARWARNATDSVTSELRELMAARKQVDDLGSAVEDRDRALGAITTERDELQRTAAQLAVDRDSAVAVAHQLARDMATKNPAALGAAVRAELERLRAVSQEDVPRVPAGAAADGGDGDQGT